MSRFTEDELDEIAFSVKDDVVQEYNDLTEVSFPEYADSVLEGDIEGRIVERAPERFEVKKDDASLIAGAIKEWLEIIFDYAHVTIYAAEARKALKKRAAKLLKLKPAPEAA